MRGPRMKRIPTVLCVVGVTICVCAAFEFIMLDSPADKKIISVLGSLLLGCFLVLIGYAQSLLAQKRERQSRQPPSYNRG
jgi:uncharacterized membrane protein